MPYSPASRLVPSSRQPLSVDAAAAVIGVSTATIRNWVKAGHLHPLAVRPIIFDAATVHGLKDDLISGRNTRLQSRANKTRSIVELVPTISAGCKNTAPAMEMLLEFFSSSKLNGSQATFITALTLLYIKGEVAPEDTSRPIQINNATRWKRECVRAEMIAWSSSIPDVTAGIPFLICDIMSKVVTDDFLGTIYQSLCNEGDRSKSGSYYTPLSAVRDSILPMKGKARSFFDPCCGTGQYLIQAASLLGISPDDVYGFDIDETATRIARVNMFLAFPAMLERPKIECADYLANSYGADLLSPVNPLYKKIQFLATNPPWGSYKNTRLANHLADEIKSGEAFSLFIAQSLRLLPDNIAMSFILPESILNIKVHSDIRRLLLNKVNITCIEKLGRPFTGVFTPVVRIDFTKSIPDEASITVIKNRDISRNVQQNRFMSNEHCVFDIDVTDRDGDIIDRVYAGDRLYLKGNAEWALGIVTGNNKSLLSDRPQIGMEAIYKGSDVMPFFLRKAKSYVSFAPSMFQQVAKERFYRADEKLIYKFISKRLVFAYDNSQSLTLNSANIVLPHLPGISIKTVMAFLNSDLYQYIFSVKFSTFKVLRSNLEAMPFPIIDKKCDEELSAVADEIMSGRKLAMLDLNRKVYKLFDMSADDISRVNSHLMKL